MRTSSALRPHDGAAISEPPKSGHHGQQGREAGSPEYPDAVIREAHYPRGKTGVEGTPSARNTVQAETEDVGIVMRDTVLASPCKTREERIPRFSDLVESFSAPTLVGMRSERSGFVGCFNFRFRQGKSSTRDVVR